MKITEAMQRIRAVRPDDYVSIEVDHTWYNHTRKYSSRFKIFVQPSWDGSNCGCESADSLDKAVDAVLSNYTFTPPPPAESIDEVCDLTP